VVCHVEFISTLYTVYDENLKRVQNIHIYYLNSKTFNNKKRQSN